MIAVGDRVRIAGKARYLWGRTGELLAIEAGVAHIQLDRPTGVGLPDDFMPEWRQVAVSLECLEAE